LVKTVNKVACIHWCSNWLWYNCYLSCICGHGDCRLPWVGYTNVDNIKWENGKEDGYASEDVCPGGSVYMAVYCCVL